MKNKSPSKYNYQLSLIVYSVFPSQAEKLPVNKQQTLLNNKKKNFHRLFTHSSQITAFLKINVLISFHEVMRLKSFGFD